MAYASIYTFDFTGLQGDTFNIDIEKDGFIGYPKALINLPGRSPVTIDRDRSEFIGKTIRSSVLTLTISATYSGLEVSELIDFVSSESREYKITVYKNSTIIWVGWLQPIENFELDLYNLSELDLVFVDGLVHLKNLNAPYTNYEAFSFAKLKNIINDCLALTGHSFDVQYISSIVDPDEDTEALWSRISLQIAALLQQGTGGYINSIDALELICSKLGCVLYQQGELWVVQNIMEGEATAAQGTLMLADGTAGETLSAYPRTILPLFDASNPLERNLTARLFSPIVNAETIAQFQKNRMANGTFNFYTWDGVEPDGWGFGNAIEVQQASGGWGSPYAIDFEGYYSAIEPQPNRWLEFSQPFAISEGDKIIVGWKWETLLPIGENVPLNRVQVFFQHETDSLLDRWLDGDGDWQATETFIYFDNSGLNDVGDMIVTVPGKGTITGKAYNPEATSATGESQSTHYVRLYYFGIIVIRDSEANSEAKFAKYNEVRQKTSRPGTFSNGTIDPVNVLGYQGLGGKELPDVLMTVESTQQFLGNERDSLQNDELLSCFINSDFQITTVGSPNAFIPFQLLKFIQANRFVLQGDFEGGELQIGETYSFELLPGNERNFICVGFVYDLKVGVQSTTVLIECNLGSISESVSETIYQ